MTLAFSENTLARFSERMAGELGLHFPRERWRDLDSGLRAMAGKLGMAASDAGLEPLLTEPLAGLRLEVVASELTVGETYFFRDARAFELLRERVLPDLIAQGETRGRQLRIWSAGCCTGEEPYSIAILLDRYFPALRSWRVTILGTDLNAHFLRRAQEGVFGEWSFRDAPDWLKDNYFKALPGRRYELLPRIRERVTFGCLNLAGDAFPSPANGTSGCDVIFCRNVLMYFTPAQTRGVIGKLHRALNDGGWLAVSPTEASQALFPQFVALNAPAAIFYRKDASSSRNDQASSSAVPEKTPTFFAVVDAPTWTAPEETKASPLPPEESPVVPPRSESSRLDETAPTAKARAESLCAQGRYAEAVDTLLSAPAGDAPDAQTFSLLARAAANQGRLADALAWCDRWIATDKLDPAGHHLRAVILLEQGDAPQARSALQRAVYLQPDFVLAHFTLGSVARGGGKSDEAEKHFGNALRLLARYQPDDPLPAADGLTAGRLAETIAALSARKIAP
jgi:chemotaxis protein methyltransferase CheR